MYQSLASLSNLHGTSGALGNSLVFLPLIANGSALHTHLLSHILFIGTKPLKKYNALGEIKWAIGMHQKKDVVLGS
jgi:hypothetical protein